MTRSYPRLAQQQAPGVPPPGTAPPLFPLRGCAPAPEQPPPPCTWVFYGKPSSGWYRRRKPAPAVTSTPRCRAGVPGSMLPPPRKHPGETDGLLGATSCSPQALRHWLAVAVTAEGSGLPTEEHQGRVHEANYLLNREVVDKVVVMFVKVTVQRDTVALVEQVLERVDPLDSQGPLYPILQVRVIKYHVEAERLGSDRNRLRSATCVRRKERGSLN